MTERIGRFEVLEKVGEGGMGEVFKARDPQINRIVAIKLLREGFNTREMRDRFMLEARSAGGLQNPYIVTIFELGEHDGSPFIVMEFLPGDPLDHLIRRRAPLSLLRKLELMEALCAGLGAAHRAGIVHRDVKPPNLMVIPDAMLKILDFGIARVGASEMTKMGVLIGTPNYMSPEQLNGTAIDTRTDIFAAGAVCYELLSYERAFPGNQTEAITRILTRDPLSLLTLCPTLEPEIAGVVDKALKKNPRERYQDLADMRRDITRIKDRLKREAPETLYQTITAETLIGDGERATTPASSRMREELRRRSMAEVDAARRLFDQGEISEALRRLEDFTPANEFVNEALAALEERADEIQREALRASTSARALQAAQEAFERGDFEAAVRAADEALLVDERLTRARDLRRHARNALDEQRRYASLMRRVTATIEEARRVFAQGNHRTALDVLTSFEPPHPEIAAVLGELQAEDAAYETELARREAERLARDVAERQRREQERCAESAAEAARLASAKTERFSDSAARPAVERQAPTSRAGPRRAAIAAVAAITLLAVSAGSYLLYQGRRAASVEAPSQPDASPQPQPVAPAPPVVASPPPQTSTAAVPAPDKKPQANTTRLLTRPANGNEAERRTQRLDADRLLRRAQDYLDTGDVDAAAAEVEKAQRIDPTHPNLPKMTADIDKLKKLEESRRIRRQGP